MTGESRAGCPLDLPAIKMARAEVTSLLPPVVDARLRHFVTDGGAEDELAVRYEQRDERGIELGTELYRCDAAGLWLVSTGPDGRRVTFVPPLPVVPFAAASGEQSGDVSIEVDTGDALAPYRFAWDAADAGATPPLADLDAEWRSVRSVLLIDHDGQRYEWATETIWAISTLGPFAAHRVQTRSAGGVSATVVEDARSVRSGNAP